MLTIDGIDRASGPPLVSVMMGVALATAMSQSIDYIAYQL